MPALGGPRDIHHAGLHHVFKGGAFIVGAAVVVHLLGAEASIRRRQGQDLVAGGLDGAGLMGGDMAHFRRNNAEGFI